MTGSTRAPWRPRAGVRRRIGRHRAKGGRWTRPLLAVAVLCLLAALPVRGALPRDDGDGETGQAGPFPADARPFTEDSAWNQPIPDEIVVDRDSQVMVDHLAGDGYANANLDAFGVPVYHADGDTPRRRVTCTRQWDACGLDQEPVPIPDGARPSPGSDGAMVVIDTATGRSYDFWQARPGPDGSWVASWGGIVDVSGDGYTPGAGQTGAGMPRLAGVVRTSEIGRGDIPHALVFSTDNACRGTHRYPASKTDGRSDRPDCIPQGSRVQLDPGLPVDEIPGLTPAERAVARALQTYGAYVVDNGGARMAFIFETPTSGEDPYPAAGLLHDYQRFDDIPWERLRVLRRWDGT